MKTTSAAWLAGVLVALGGLVYWDQWKTSQEEAEGKDKNKLLAGQAADVIEIEIEQRRLPEPEKGGEDSHQDVQAEQALEPPGRIRLKKTPDGWAIAEPLAIKADAAAVEDFLNSLFDFKYEKSVSEDKTRWNEFGVSDDDYAAKITLFGSEGKETGRVIVGNKAPVGYSSYVRGEGDQVFLGSQHIALAAGKKVNDLRDKTVFPLDRAEVASIQIFNGGRPTIQINKREGLWIISAPEVLDTDQTAVDDFLRQVESLQATHFADKPGPDQLAFFADPAKNYVIEVINGKGEKRQLTLAQHEGQHWVAVDPQVLIMQVDAGAGQDLRKELIAFRNMTIFPMKLDTLVKVEIDGVEYEKRESDWVEVIKNQSETDPKTAEESKSPHIGSLLLDMELAKTDVLLKPGSPDYPDTTQPPQHRLVLQFAERDRPPVEVLLWKTEQDKFFLKKSAEDVVYRVDGSFTANFKPESTSAPADQPTSPDDLNLLEGEPPEEDVNTN